MLRFHTLGSLDLKDSDGREILSVLAQPKRTALLAYLALGAGGRFHRRDTLLGLFWPESEPAKARASLRQAVRYLRLSLGEEVVVGRGDEELGLGEGTLWCDAVAFERAVEEGRPEEALDLYRGDLLRGFFLPDVPEFEDWLERERARLRARAVEAAWAAAEAREAARDSAGAASCARRTVELEPNDEGTLRRLVALLDRLGDRASALRAYEEFAQRLLHDCGAEPSAETRALMERVRAREEPLSVADRAPTPPLAPAIAAAEANPEVNPAPAPLAAEVGASRPRRARLAALAGLAALAAVAGAVAARDPWPDAGAAPEGVVVLPLENRTGDASLDPVGRWAADWVSQGLARTDLVRVVDPSIGLPGSTEAEPRGMRLRALLEEVGAGMVVSGAYYRDGDSIHFQVRIANAAEVSLSPGVEPVRASLREVPAAVQTLAERVTGAMAAHRHPRIRALNSDGSRPPSYEAYLAWVDGLEKFGRQDYVGSRERLMYAFSLDSSFVSPLIWAAATHGNLGEDARADSLLRIAERERERLLPFDRHLLDLWKANLEGDQAARYEAVRGMLEVAPASEVALFLMGGAAIAVNKPAEAVAAIRRIDVERSAAGWDAYGTRLTDAYHLLGVHVTELREARRARERRPEVIRTLVDEARALAAVGKADEVLRLLDGALALPPHPIVTPAAAARAAAEELRAHGQPEAARQALARALTWQRTRPRAEQASPAGRLELARILYLAGRWDEAAPLFRTLAEQFPQHVGYLGYLGVVAARAGDTGEAARAAELLSRMDRPYLRGAHTLWRARIAAASGRPGEALTLLRASLAQGQGYGLWLHVDPAFEPLRDLSAFQRLLEPQG